MHSSEIVVMDGRSTDDTVDRLKAYGGRIQWVSEPDEGQGHAGPGPPKSMRQKPAVSTKSCVRVIRHVPDCKSQLDVE
jgi:hypothetical protein